MNTPKKTTKKTTHDNPGEKITFFLIVGILTFVQATATMFAAPEENGLISSLWVSLFLPLATCAFAILFIVGRMAWDMSVIPLSMKRGIILPAITWMMFPLIWSIGSISPQGLFGPFMFWSAAIQIPYFSFVLWRPLSEAASKGLIIRKIDWVLPMKRQLKPVKTC